MQITAAWDSRYEKKAIVLLCLGFGLVGLDRFMIMPLFPVVQRALHLSYRDLGLVTGALSISWGIAALVASRISDRIGHRQVLVVSLLVFSLLAGLSGLATSLLALVAIRAVMGLAEGAFTPSSLAATVEAAKPQRHGLMLGVQQAAMPLFGMALAPILATQLLNVLDWRYAFLIVVPPGLLVAWAMSRIIRNPVTVKGASSATRRADPTPEADRLPSVYSYRNVRLNILGMFCWLTCLNVLTAMMPSYLIDGLHYGMQQMGFVLSAMGLGCALGSFVLLGLSDRLGRKTVLLGSAGATALAVAALSQVSSPGWVFIFLAIACFFNFGALTLTTGPLSAESVPPALVASACGVAVGFGEIFGGGVAPMLAGMVASQWGIGHIFVLAIAAMVIGLVIASLLRETTPETAQVELVAEMPPGAPGE
jgi:MFS family permease